MSRSRATEMPHRPSPRAPSNLLRTSSSDSDPIPYRSRTERSPKLVDGRSPRSAQSDPVNQKKLGSRIADLESQLGQAQQELKCLKDQLASAEADKKAAQIQLDKKSKKVRKVPNSVEIQEKPSNKVEPGLNKKDTRDECEPFDDFRKETDVFEVPVEKVTAESKTDVVSLADQDELKPKSISLATESPAISATDILSSNELAMENDEINLLKSKLEERDTDLEVFRQENANIKRQLHEKSSKITSAESEIEELSLKLNKANQELEKRKTDAVHINEKLEATEKAKEKLENEMKRLQVQTEQWRKAADAAAAVLAGEVEMNGRRIYERCGSMDKHYVNAFESASAYAGIGSPELMDDPEDVFGGGKRKNSGIRIFGDLWRKKGHK